MNRNQRRIAAKFANSMTTLRPAALTLISPEAWPMIGAGTSPRIAVWHSRKYIVQQFREPPLPAQPAPIVIYRITVCRSSVQTDLSYEANITWEELQAVKREIGYGDWYGFEVFPRDCDLVNVANMRHLWLLQTPLPIGWFSRGEAQTQADHAERPVPGAEAGQAG